MADDHAPTRSRSCASGPAPGIMDCKRALEEAERRPREGRRAAARARPGRGGQEGRPRGPRGPRRRATSTPAAASACSSRSTARPTSSPAPTSSRSSSGTSRCRSPAWRPQYVDDRARSRPTRSRPSGPSCWPTSASRRSPRTSAPRSSRASCSKWYQQVVLYEQPFRDTDRTVGELITEAIATIGENIRVRRFVRYAARGGAVSDAAPIAAGAGRRRRGPLPADPAEAVAARRCSATAHVRRRPRDLRVHRRARSREVHALGVAGRHRRRRRQHLPRPRRGGRGHGPRDRRLHRHARHGHERPGAPGRAREGRRPDAGHVARSR